MNFDFRVILNIDSQNRTGPDFFQHTDLDATKKPGAKILV